MVVKYFTPILYVTGGFTMLGIIQFLLPSTMLNATDLKVSEGAGMAFARHWGLMAFCFGALLVYAANHLELRRPIVCAAAVEKLGMVAIIAMSWSDPLLAGLRPVLITDSVTVLLYVIYLLSDSSSKENR